MSSLKVAAQFAAYTWYMECKETRPETAEAARFARDNWREFLGAAPLGLGRLLRRVGRLDRPKVSRKRRQLARTRQSA